MRRIDVWVGRFVAMAGLIYVTLASLWPISASGAERLSMAAPTIGTTSESLAMLLVAVAVLCAAVATTVVLTTVRRRSTRASPTARSACRPHPAAAA